ncbi:hypothetical protein I553_7664 [Mycobacterium xenopi 4042]|uniref:Uncharacterized protein n=1 Tax=Mycobacterium xenopi 4042 TaxID=1299334 RepID=X8ANS8_MYCXE|nr:hypothetical protein I553_7664 [Mycobacterium xenopi 4042]
MATELPAERLHRRLAAPPGSDSRSDADTADDTDDSADPNSLLPRWLPDGSVHGGPPGWRKSAPTPVAPVLSRWQRSPGLPCW